MRLKIFRIIFDFSFDTTGWNPVVLLRLLLDKLIPSNVDKLIYLDGDTIVRGCLDDLWETNINNKVFGMSIEPTIDKSRYKQLSIEGFPYYNAGVLLINLKRFREINAGKTIIDYYRSNDGRLFANDQDAINASMKNEILTISCKYNYYNIFDQYPYGFLKKQMAPVKYLDKETFEEAKKNPIIIHYLGEERPWRKGNTHKYRKDYKKYLDKTYWKDTPDENGWQLYFICWKVFNTVTKPFPSLRLHIINSLIPTFISYRSKKVK